MSIVVRATHHGPIVSDVQTSLQQTRTPFTISMRWTGYELNDPIGTILALNRARTWEEFQRGTRRLHGPGAEHGLCRRRRIRRLQIRGRSSRSGAMPAVCSRSPGGIPRRSGKGSSRAHGFPRMLNPPEGFVASANNKVVDDSYPYPMGDLWEPPARIQRLRELLAEHPEAVTVADCERWQNDRVSPLAMQLVPYVLQVCADSARSASRRGRGSSSTCAAGTSRSIATTFPVRSSIRGLSGSCGIHSAMRWGTACITTTYSW